MAIRHLGRREVALGWLPVARECETEDQLAAGGASGELDCGRPGRFSPALFPAWRRHRDSWGYPGQCVRRWLLWSGPDHPESGRDAGGSAGYSLVDATWAGRRQFRRRSCSLPGHLWWRDCLDRSLSDAVTLGRAGITCSRVTAISVIYGSSCQSHSLTLAFTQSISGAVAESNTLALAFRQAVAVSHCDATTDSGPTATTSAAAASTCKYLWSAGESVGLQLLRSGWLHLQPGSEHLPVLQLHPKLLEIDGRIRR